MTRTLAILTLAALIHVARSAWFRDTCAFLAMCGFVAALAVWMPVLARLSP